MGGRSRRHVRSSEPEYSTIPIHPETINFALMPDETGKFSSQLPVQLQEKVSQELFAQCMEQINAPPTSSYLETVRFHFYVAGCLLIVSILLVIALPFHFLRPALNIGLLCLTLFISLSSSVAGMLFYHLDATRTLLEIKGRIARAGTMINDIILFGPSSNHPHTSRTAQLEIQSSDGLEVEVRLPPADEIRRNSAIAWRARTQPRELGRCWSWLQIVSTDNLEAINIYFNPTAGRINLPLQAPRSSDLSSDDVPGNPM